MFYGPSLFCYCRLPCTIFEPISCGFKATRDLSNMISRILQRLVLFSLCLQNVYGQNVANGSYVGLQDSKYVSREKHKIFKWFHLTRLTIKNDSVWVEQDPVYIHKRDTIWSASDGAFYYFEGTIKTNGKQITMDLNMTNCDYCGIPEDSVKQAHFFHKIWNGQMTNNGIVMDSSFYNRTEHQAMRWPKPPNEWLVKLNSIRTPIYSRINALKGLKPESKESDELEVLSILLKEYELDHYPIPKPSPLEAINFRLEQMGMSEAQLSDILDYRSRKSEIL